MQDIIHFTDRAIEHIHNTIAKRGKGIGFRLSVKKTGCSGYMYVPEIVDEENCDDEKIQLPQGLAIYLDRDCIAIIRGTTLDFVGKGLGMQTLMFDNPNAQGTCGCGESFHLQEGQDD